ncbi:MAG: hypothetical protein IJM42_07855 [Synergistes sp.]|nr:hypothetical protein [Synergistes sp.]
MIRKLFASVMLTVLLCSALPAAAADPAGWDEFVEREMAREKIREEGPGYFSRTALLAPEGSDAELWQLSLAAPTPEVRAAAACALVNKWFPDGDPANWEAVRGFLPASSYVPKQIVAVNALFNAVDALRYSQEGKYAAAWLMMRFASSSRAKLLFIEEMPQYFRNVLDELLAEVKMPGDWSSKKIEGPYPFVPLYDGIRTVNYAITNGLQFIDGTGGLASFGYYAWDRANGLVYRVEDPGNHIFRRFD